MEVDKITYECFLDLVEVLDYKEEDEKEAKDFGCNNVVDCFKMANPFFAEFYHVKDNDKSIALYCIQRDGFIVLFTTKHLNKSNAVSYIKLIKKELNKAIDKHNSLFVKVANWYVGAIKFVKLLGFRPIHISSGWTIYGKWKDEDI